MTIPRCLVTVVFIIIVANSYSQNYESSNLQYQLDSLSQSGIPQLNEPVDISLNNIPLSEFMRILANHTGLNLNVDPNLNISVNNNFSGVKAKDVILMVCDEYNLECSTYGSIITIKKRPQDNQKLDVIFDENKTLVSFEVKNTELDAFARELTKKTGINFFYTRPMAEKIINGFARDLPVMNALEGLAHGNNFVVKNEKDQLFIIEPLLAKERESTNFDFILEDRLQVDDQNRISVAGNNLSADLLFKTVTNKLNVPYHQLSSIEAEKTLSLEKVSFDDFLNALVSGTKQTYKYQNGILYVGNRMQQDLKTNKVVKFFYRRVDSLTEVIPKSNFPNLEINEFSEMNSLIITGDADVIEDAVLKIKELDVSVPVVLIDVIIVDVSNTDELQTGIEAGILKDGETLEKGGTLTPGIDYTMDASSVNSVIADLGLTKLGKVTPNFYVKLKALETNGSVDIRSTPQLSTLNGHPATLSIGETQYYEEKRNVYQGSLNPQLEALTTYLPVEAQLGIVIKPFVTGNGDVTLEIEVEQSNFTERFKDDAPPGLISRKFKSMIRVKNQEMVLLGGLEELLKEKSRSGMPGIARIPVLNWFFSKRTNKNNKSRLNIFIKPTILF